MPLDLYLMPFELPQSYWGLAPSAVKNFSDISLRKVPLGNLLVLSIFRGWRSPRRVLCIHWSTELYGSNYLVKSLLLFCMQAAGLWLLKNAYGFTVVWVLHNNYAHEYPHPHIDALGRAFLRSQADVIVAQQRQTKRLLEERHPAKKIAYIPHPNAVGVYGPIIADKARARKQFNLPQKDTVLLLFGAIRPYKRIEQIIDACAEANDPSLLLWLVGKGSDAYIKHLTNYANGKVRLQVHGFVPDAQIPSCLACADYSLYYFDESELTSGSVILSLSYGTPVISRAIAGAEMVTPQSGFLFSTKEELIGLLKDLSKKPSFLPEQVMRSVAEFDPKKLEREYHELYQSLV